MNRKEILEAATKLTMGDRNEAYGSPWRNLTDCAELFEAYLRGRYNVELTLTAEDVAWFNVMQKMARTFVKTPRLDNYIDATAYAAIAGECRFEEPQ